jgi:UDP-N-acetylglucosamine 2-epimerase (non-hydrolysing)
MKLAPLVRALAGRVEARHVVVHTGQHYGEGMSGSFFHDLGIPEPDHNLGAGSASHAQQTAGVMQRIEPILLETGPAVVIVYGDVNSTVAAALVAAKLGIRVAHVEAGLRSRDWTMPEEINRVVADRLSDFLFTPSRDGDENLRAEGMAADRIHFVGNIMIDSLVHALPAARALDAPKKYAVRGERYALVTLHRPSNVDDPDALRGLLGALDAIGHELPVIFPVHPRTQLRLEALDLRPSSGSRLRLLEPIGYLDMLGLVEQASLVITDSGGLQEETSFLGVPCLTVRPNTERPVTCTRGTNRLVSPTRDALLAAAHEALRSGVRRSAGIERWDGKTAERIVGVLLDGEEYR